jgi:hypothetical protein
MNEDVVLLWPLLFEGQLHYVGQDPLAGQMDEASLTPSGTGWWGNRRGAGRSTTEGEQEWLHILWRGR